MVYDPVNHQIILFGGRGEQDRLGDTWLNNISDRRWKEVTPTGSPAPRSDAGMAYDEENQIVILFGGYCQEENRGQCDDTWSYDPMTNTWLEYSPVYSPPITYGHTMVYDDTNHETILWGGHMSTFRNGQIASAGYGDSIWNYVHLENVWREKVHSNKPPQDIGTNSRSTQEVINLFSLVGTAVAVTSMTPGYLTRSKILGKSSARGKLHCQGPTPR
jgi:hypothetical protein